MEVFVYLSVIFGVLLVLAAIRSRFMGFRGQRSVEYAGLGPEFDLTRHLGGRNICEGVIFGPTGRMTSRFRAVMTGEWTGSDGAVDVDFEYDGGGTQHRVWHLSLGDNGRVSARAEDVQGEGRGRVTGPTVQLLYTIMLPEDSGGYVLSVTDWMYLTEGGTILNRSQFRKGGLLVAELMATIRKDA